MLRLHADIGSSAKQPRTFKCTRTIQNLPIKTWMRSPGRKQSLVCHVHTMQVPIGSNRKIETTSLNMSTPDLLTVPSIRSTSCLIPEPPKNLVSFWNWSSTKWLWHRVKTHGCSFFFSAPCWKRLYVFYACLYSRNGWLFAFRVSTATWQTWPVPCGQTTIK